MRRLTLDASEKFLGIVLTPVHLDFITLTPFLIPLLASDKASLFYNSTCSGRLKRTFVSLFAADPARHCSSCHSFRFGGRLKPTTALAEAIQCHRKKIGVDGACLRAERRMTQPSVVIAERTPQQTAHLARCKHAFRQSTWLRLDRSGDSQVALWMSRCWNLLLPTILFRAAAKSIAGRNCRVEVPTVRPKIPFCPTFALKSPRIILMSWAEHLSYRSSRFAYNVSLKLITTLVEHKN